MSDTYTVTYGGEHVITSADSDVLLKTLARALDVAGYENTSTRRVWLEQVGLDVRDGTPLVLYCFYGIVRIYGGRYRPVETDWTAMVGRTTLGPPATNPNSQAACSDVNA